MLIDHEKKPLSLSNQHMGIIDELYPDIEKFQNGIFMIFWHDYGRKTIVLSCSTKFGGQFWSHGLLHDIEICAQNFCKLNRKK